MSRTPKETAQEWYAAVHAGDFDRLFAVIAEDCTVEFYGPPVIPFAGTFRGREKVKIFFGHVANDVEIQEFRQEQFIAEEDSVAVTGYLKMLLKATGRLYAANYAHILTIRDEQVVRFRDFQDTAQAAHASQDLNTPDR